VHTVVIVVQLLAVAWHRKSATKTRTQQLVTVPTSDSVLFLSSQGRVKGGEGREGREEQKGPFVTLMCFEQICVAPVTAADNDSDTEKAEHVVA